MSGYHTIVWRLQELNLRTLDHKPTPPTTPLATRPPLWPPTDDSSKETPFLAKFLCGRPQKEQKI